MAADSVLSLLERKELKPPWPELRKFSVLSLFFQGQLGSSFVLWSGAQSESFGGLVPSPMWN